MHAADKKSLSERDICTKFMTPTLTLRQILETGQKTELAKLLKAMHVSSTGHQ